MPNDDVVHDQWVHKANDYNKVYHTSFYGSEEHQAGEILDKKDTTAQIYFARGMSEKKIRQKFEKILAGRERRYDYLRGLIVLATKKKDQAKVLVISPKAGDDKNDVACYFIAKFDFNSRCFVVMPGPENLLIESVGDGKTDAATLNPDIKGHVTIVTEQQAVEQARSINDKADEEKEQRATLDAEHQRLVLLVDDLESANRDRQAIDIMKIKSVFNDFLKTVPQETLAQKKQLSEWMNAAVRQFGLAIECPSNPGLAVEMKGEVGNYPGRGSFQFTPIEGDGTRKKRVTFTVLPELNLIPFTNNVDLSIPFRDRDPGRS